MEFATLKTQHELDQLEQEAQEALKMEFGTLKTQHEMEQKALKAEQEALKMD